MYAPFGLVVLVAALSAALWALAGHARGRDLHADLTSLRWKRIGRVLALLALLAWLYKLALARDGFGRGVLRQARSVLAQARPLAWSIVIVWRSCLCGPHGSSLSRSLCIARA